MHSVSPYTIRCYNSDLPGDHKDRYCPLNDIKGFDIFALIKNFIESHSDSLYINDHKQLVYGFSNVDTIEETREIFGWLEVGSYGVKSDIINIETGKIDYEKTTKNAEIIKHFFIFSLPKAFNEGICVFHKFRGDGIKTLFHDLLSPFFKEKTGLVLQINPLTDEKLLNEWHEAQTKEIRVIKFSGFSDIADTLLSSGHFEKEYRIKARRNMSLGIFKDFFDKQAKEAQIIEALSNVGTQVKAVVELNGKKRVFGIGNKEKNNSCSIEVDDNIVEMKEGSPVFDSFKKWVQELIKDFQKHIYKT